MKIAVLSDIHANSLALAAVLEDALDQGAEKFWCLGDVVGYYTDPVDALVFLKDFVRPECWVMGNHDAMLADLLLPELGDVVNKNTIQVPTAMGKGETVLVRGIFLSDEEWMATNQTPIDAIRLNRKALSLQPEIDAFWHKTFVPKNAIPKTIKLKNRTHLLVHASLSVHLFRYLNGWKIEYFLPPEFDILQKYYLEQKIPHTLWVGHTHVPMFVTAQSKKGGGFDIHGQHGCHEQIYSLEDLTIVNPGSVGQPRNKDRRASYAILDTTASTVTFQRVDYPWRKMAPRLLQQDYPESLAIKLIDAPPHKDTPATWIKHYDDCIRKD